MGSKRGMGRDVWTLNLSLDNIPSPTPSAGNKTGRGQLLPIGKGRGYRLVPECFPDSYPVD